MPLYVLIKFCVPFPLKMFGFCLKLLILMFALKLNSIRTCFWNPYLKKDIVFLELVQRNFTRYAFIRCNIPFNFIMIVFANLALSLLLSNITDLSSTSYLCSKSVITFVICNFLTILSIVTSIICVNMVSLCKPFIMLNRIGLDTSQADCLGMELSLK